MQIRRHAAKEGRDFKVGNTMVWVGPGPDDILAKHPPVLAYYRPDMKSPEIVGSFSSASKAEKFIAAMDEGALEWGQVVAAIAEKAKIIERIDEVVKPAPKKRAPSRKPPAPRAA
jgi:hypothetical protein